MNTYQQKMIALMSTPKCPRCGCKMIAIKDNPQKQSYPSHAAILHPLGGVICYQCRRIEVKKQELAKQPFFRRLRIRFDNATGILSYIKTTRRRLNKWWYITVCGNIPNGKP